MQLSASRLSCTVPGTGAFRPSRQLSSYSSQFRGGLHAKHWHRQAPARGSGCRRTAVRAGLPIPIVGGLFNPTTAILLWAAGAANFWRNFSSTPYEQSEKLRLTALWPVLYVGSESFRAAFKKTLSG